MRIGVVSDTHDNMTNVARIVDLFNRARVERIVHTGDITKAKTLEVLARLHAPIHGVYGNNDLERESLERAAERFGLHFVDPPLRLQWAERSIVVVHDITEHRESTLHGGDVLLHGHDHFYRFERRNGTVLFNPGECAGHMQGYNAVGVLDLEALDSELLTF
jgi:putative phosphoesterase